MNVCQMIFSTVVPLRHNIIYIDYERMNTNSKEIFQFLMFSQNSRFDRQYRTFSVVVLLVVHFVSNQWW